MAGPRIHRNGLAAGSPGAVHKAAPVATSKAYMAGLLVATNTTSFTTAGELRPTSLLVAYRGGDPAVYLRTWWAPTATTAVGHASASVGLFQSSARTNGVVGASISTRPPR